jgi:hypothetical protein
MKVSELLKKLEDADPDATVLLCTQSHWPFEYTLEDVVIREEIMDPEDEMPPRYDEGARANDVLLVEGRQLRYGQKTAWR